MVSILERDVTPSELERMSSGFGENTLDQGVLIQTSERLGTVAMDGERFVGAASGLAYKNAEAYTGWFYLTDLFVEKNDRHRGVGTKLLAGLEQRLSHLGIHTVWTWTAQYEAPDFYRRLGYVVFAELENWYSGGQSRIAVRKALVEPEQDRA